MMAIMISHMGPIYYRINGRDKFKNHLSDIYPGIAHPVHPSNANNQFKYSSVDTRTNIINSYNAANPDRKLTVPQCLHLGFAAYIGHTINGNKNHSSQLQDKYCEFVNILQSKYHNTVDEDALAEGKHKTIKIVRTNVYVTDNDCANDEEYQEFLDAFEVLTNWIPIRFYV